MSESDPANLPAVGPYFQALAERLEALDRDELVTAITAYAARLSPPDRLMLLSSLRGDPSAAAPGHEAAWGDTDDPSDLAVLDDIDAFVDALKSGEFVSEFGWDSDIFDERVWGDEGWTDDMDELFARADDLFFGGRHALARDAYRRLLGALLLEQEDVEFPGSPIPRSMLATPISQAVARYLRCIYATEGPDARAPVLLEAARKLIFVTDSEVSLRDIADAAPGALAGFDDFLDRWISELEQSDDAGDAAAWGGALQSPFRRQRQGLLREAVQLRDGLEGLKDLARRAGAHHPDAYREWMTTLDELGRDAEAIEAGREGLVGIADDAERARFADAVVRLALDHADVAPDIAAEAALSAWRSAPSVARMVRLCGCHLADEDTLDAVITSETEWLRSVSRVPGGGSASSHRRAPESRTPGRSGRTSDGLLTALELLSGNYDAVNHRLRNAAPLAWSDDDYAGRVAVPGLLAAAVGIDAIPTDGHSEITGLWRTLHSAVQTSQLRQTEDGVAALFGSDASAVFEAYAALDEVLGAAAEPDAMSSLVEPVRFGQDRQQGTETPDYTDLLAWAIRRRPPASSERANMLETVVGAATARTEAIVRGKKRGAYQRAAKLVTACAEAHALLGDRASARAILQTVRSEYARYYSFVRKLEAAVRDSVVLGPIFVPKRR